MKRLIPIILTLSIVVSLSACGLGGSSLTEEATSSSIPTYEEDITSQQLNPFVEAGQDSANDSFPGYEMYRQKIQDIRDLINKVGSGEQIDYSEDNLFMGFIARMTEYLGVETARNSFGWRAMDLNGDALSELVIGYLPGQDRPVQIIAVYTYFDNELKLLIEGWERNRWNMLDGNTFYNEGSNGAIYSVFGEYELNADAAEINCIDYYFSYEKVSGNWDEIGYYHNTVGVDDKNESEELPKGWDEFFEIQNRYYERIVSPELIPFTDDDTAADSGADSAVIDDHESEAGVDGSASVFAGLLKNGSTEFNPDLAKVCAEMSEATEIGQWKIEEVYRKYGLGEIEPHNFTEDSAFCFSYTMLNINGEQTPFLVITTRGTSTVSEGVGDFFHGNFIGNDIYLKTLSDIQEMLDFTGLSEHLGIPEIREFRNRHVSPRYMGYELYLNVNEYVDLIWDGIRDYVEAYPELTDSEHIKILITGHSLGGAAANLLAARFTRFSELDGTEWWAQSTSKDDIYCYTFGAIDVLTQRINITDGYENIHNIYNFLDSFNCVGGHALGGLNVSSPVSLFGHTDLFLYDFTLENLGSMDQDSKKYAEENFNSITKNHNMPTYIQALDLDLVHCRHDLLLEITGNVDVQIKDADGNIMEDFRYRDFHSPLSIDASTFMGSKVIVLLEGNSNYSVHIEGPAFSQIIARVYDTTDFRLLKEETKTTFLFSKTLDISIPQ